MQLKQLFGDDNAVSPVIGVILMVAITVILAAVIGTLVMDLGNTVNQDATASVSVSGNTATLTSLGPSTTGIQCSADESENTETVGESITCSGSESVVAYSDEDGITDAAVYTFD